MLSHLKFRHFGLAVKDPSQAKVMLETLGYSIGPDVKDDAQGVFVCEASHKEHPRVEMIWPLSKPSPIDEVLKKGNGNIYHTCWETSSLADVLKELEEKEIAFKEVSSPESAPLFSGKKVSFYYIQGFGLIEILES